MKIWRFLRILEPLESFAKLLIFFMAFITLAEGGPGGRGAGRGVCSNTYKLKIDQNEFVLRYMIKFLI